MVSTKSLRCFLFLFLNFLSFVALFAQSSSSTQEEVHAAVSLEADALALGTLDAASDAIEEGLRTLRLPKEKAYAYRALARLRELAGQYSAASTAWKNAAFAVPGFRDDYSLLSSAINLLLAGELKRASADIQTVLITGQDAEMVSKAKYLSVAIAIIERNPASKSLAEAFLSEASTAQWHPALLFLLQHSYPEEALWRERLLADFPKSPEAQSLSTTASSLAISANAFWLLGPGFSREQLLLGAPIPSSSVAQSPTPNERTQGAEESILLQVGYFRSMQNAQNLKTRLEAKGFEVRILEQKSGASSSYTVLVPGGEDFQSTVLRLKDAGFEAFVH